MLGNDVVHGVKKMNLYTAGLVGLLLFVSGGMHQVQAADSNWKQGRIYYRMVCTACHKGLARGSIAPASMTQAEWAAYLGADQHAKGQDLVSHYVSQEYRNQIKGENRAAAKFAHLPNASLMADVQAFVIHGAKDSDTPARCN
jgi:hypothetical protein